jgi:hypothetical protein
MALKTLGWALAVMLAASTTVVGVGAVKPPVVMREPVTMISLSSGTLATLPAEGGASAPC